MCIRDRVTDTFQIRAYGFFVSESLVFVVSHVVGYFAGFGHFAYLYLDGCYALGNFAYKLFPVGTEAVSYTHLDVYKRQLLAWRNLL